jgi:hypothetical protein
VIVLPHRSTIPRRTPSITGAAGTATKTGAETQFEEPGFGASANLSRGVVGSETVDERGAGRDAGAASCAAAAAGVPTLPAMTMSAATAPDSLWDRICLLG